MNSYRAPLLTTTLADIHYGPTQQQSGQPYYDSRTNGASMKSANSPFARSTSSLEQNIPSFPVYKLLRNTTRKFRVSSLTTSSYVPGQSPYQRKMPRCLNSRRPSWSSKFANGVGCLIAVHRTSHGTTWRKRNICWNSDLAREQRNFDHNRNPHEHRRACSLPLMRRGRRRNPLHPKQACLKQAHPDPLLRPADRSRLGIDRKPPPSAASAVPHPLLPQVAAAAAAAAAATIVRPQAVISEPTPKTGMNSTKPRCTDIAGPSAGAAPRLQQQEQAHQHGNRGCHP